MSRKKSGIAVSEKLLKASDLEKQLIIKWLWFQTLVALVITWRSFFGHNPRGSGSVDLV